MIKSKNSENGPTLISDIENLYNKIKTLKDISELTKMVEGFYIKYEISEEKSLGEYFIKSLKKNKVEDKYKGVVYTPIEISRYIIENTISLEEYINNPFMKILDPCCGMGNLVKPLINYLYGLVENNIDQINKVNGMNLRKEFIFSHIINNNIHCFEIDQLAVAILVIDIFKSTGTYIKNIYEKDFLFAENIEEEYDFILENPPYIGNKYMDIEYRKKVKNKYKDIYIDKSDISYCFIKKSIEILKNNGKLGMITSRYFIESISGEAIRNYITKYMDIWEMVDFYGVRPFKGVGIDPAIILMIKNKKNREFIITRPHIEDYKGEEFKNNVFYKNEGKIHKFLISNSNLEEEGWIIQDCITRNIVKKIENKSKVNLSYICDSYQGIITGCDKAFIIDENIATKNNIEKTLLKPWIKNSCIEKMENKEKSFIIYSNLIDDEEKYKNALNHIGKFSEKLKDRRECKKGIRKWYELQWGRDIQLFQEEKIIFPYKCDRNKFILDIGNFFSADIYALKLKQPYKLHSRELYKVLLFLLNSKTYNFYYKTFGKKLGGSIYEYYPNNLMKLKIPYLLQFSKLNEEELYLYFGFNNEEVELIERNFR